MVPGPPHLPAIRSSLLKCSPLPLLPVDILLLIQALCHPFAIHFLKVSPSPGPTLRKSGVHRHLGMFQAGALSGSIRHRHVGLSFLVPSAESGSNEGSIACCDRLTASGYFSILLCILHC